MNALARDFERRADEQAKSAATLFEATDFAVSPKKQALFVVAKTTANMLHVLTELATYLKANDQLDAVTAHRQEIMERNNAIRIAVAAGKWDEFDRLVAEFSESSAPESDGT